MDKNKLPKFKYHPNVYECGEVKFSKGICNCCGKEVDAYVQHMYTRAHVDCICMDCVASGKETEKFDGSFDGYDFARECLGKDGSLCGYLFRCLHCGKYYLRVDAD